MRAVDKALTLVFRGEAAPASLKRRGPLRLRDVAELRRVFRGEAAPASLKQVINAA